jgi:hypothetical protein
MAHQQRPRDPSAMDPRLSSQDGRATMFSLFVVFAIVAAVFAGFYLFSSSAPTTVADTSIGPAITQPVDPTAPPTPKTQHEETRPAQAPIRQLSFTDLPILDGCRNRPNLVASVVGQIKDHEREEPDYGCNTTHSFSTRLRR